MAAFGSKTPVSIINEHFIAKGITPSFECIAMAGQAHNPTFTYRVSAGDYFADGTGPSKQKAKHEAAKTLLEVIKSEIDKEPPHSSDQLLRVIDNLSCPQENCMSINAVGDLMTYCVVRNNPEPIYTCIKTEGPAHARNFTMQCLVSKLSEFGEGRTKKEAKHQSAFNMLVKLKQLYGDTQNELIELRNLVKEEDKKREVYEETVRKEKLDDYATGIYNKRTLRTVVNSTRCISHYRSYGVYLDSSATLNQLVCNTETDLLSHPMKTLLTISNELNIRMETTPFFLSNQLNTVFVKVEFPVPIVCGGSSEDEASRIALEHLMECCLLK